MLNFIKYINFVNDYRIIFKIYHIIKRDCRIFEMKKKIKFAKLKRITTIEVLL